MALPTLSIGRTAYLFAFTDLNVRAGEAAQWTCRLIPISGTLSFPVGVQTKTLTVTVIGDKVKEANETFYVNLSNPSANAYLGDGQALGTIVNDD